MTAPAAAGFPSVASAPAQSQATLELTLGTRLWAFYAVLTVMNVGAWVWAFAAFHGRPAMLGIALVVYGLGVRHAVDADHIAAIDNVTRKLMQGGDRPVGVGFFFAFGHSLVIVTVTAAVTAAAGRLGAFQSLRGVGGLISTGVSVLFLCVVAAMNLLIFTSVYHRFKRIRAGEQDTGEDLDILLNSRGLLSRLFRPLFGLISRSWHMAPLGFLFGLGFDTATEVAMFGVSALQVTHGSSARTVMVFPCLFASGMALIDTTDGVLMLRAYSWAFVTPLRKLHYNMAITAVSIVVAILIAGIEVLGLERDHAQLTGAYWRIAGSLAGNLNSIGFSIIGIFMATWLGSFLLHRYKRLPARREG